MLQYSINVFGRFPVWISVWLSGILKEAFHKISQTPGKFLFHIHQDHSLLRTYLLVIYDNRFLSVLLDDTAILLTWWMHEWWVWSNGRMILIGEHRSTYRKNLPQCHNVQREAFVNWRRIEPGPQQRETGY